MTMRRIAASIALLSCCAAPLQAQTFEGGAPVNGASPVATGGFVGARLRIPLGGTKEGSETVRAGLTVAPMQRSDSAGLKGPVWRIGEGLEFGFTGDGRSPHVSLAGQRLTGARHAPGRSTPTKGRSNMSDAGTVALVVGGLAVLAGVGLLVALDAQGDDDRCCE
jgi:hypothetical protein